MEPIHVGSGAFRVDRARMLAKLVKFQFAGPTEYVTAWLRTAAASGATRIEIKTAKDGFSMRFDGRPFTSEQLETVYDALFDTEGPDGRRRHYLAVGLLGCLRTEPGGVAIASGSGARRMELVARSLLEERVAPADSVAEDTRIRVWGTPTTRDQLEAHAGRVLAPPTAVDALPCAASLEPAEREAPRIDFDHHGLKAVVVRRLDGPESAVRLYVDGVWAQDLEVDRCPAPVWAAASSPALQVDASQARVVHDPALREVVGLVRGAAEELFEKALAGQRRKLRAAGRVMRSDRRLVDVWNDAFDAHAASHPTLAGRLARTVRDLASGQASVPDAARAEIAEAARVTRWLRLAAVRGLLGWEARAARPSEMLKPAWTAPVFLDWRGKPLSPLELKIAVERNGSIEWSEFPRDPNANPERHPIVWLTGPHDLKALKALFPRAAFYGR